MELESVTCTLPDMPFFLLLSSSLASRLPEEGQGVFAKCPNRSFAEGFRNQNVFSGV